MAPVSVLGKRAGPLDTAEESMLDTLQQLSTTPNTVNCSPVDTVPQNTSMQYPHQSFCGATPNQHQHAQQQAYYNTQQLQQHQMQQQQHHQQQQQQLTHLQHLQQNGFPTAFQPGVMYPQAVPPRDPLPSPHSPLMDFGEKRRRVGGFKHNQSMPHNLYGSQPQLTPQTPTSHGLNMPRHFGEDLSPNRRNMAHHNRHHQYNNNGGASSGNRTATANSNGGGSTTMVTTQHQDQQQQHLQQQIASLPGMPFIMDPVSVEYSNSQSEQQRRQPATGSATSALAPIMPTISQAPASTVVTKPRVALSMVRPPARSQRQTLQDTLQALPPQKPTKPQEVALPKVVDVDPNTECDDSGGHYNVIPGEWFAGRYLVIKLLGQGTFGKVAQAWDERTRQHCAIKIIRAVPKYRDASKVELRVLSLIGNCDPSSQMRCVRMRECFDYRNHVCIVTDLHDISVYDFLRDNQFLPFPGSHIHHFAKQIIASVAFIHSLGLVHTDLKPENVLLASSASHQTVFRRQNSRSRRPVRRKELDCTDVTLIDFGSAVFDDEYHSSVVSTRHYRAPEIILGTGWSYPCDMWSIGCLLVELCTGRVLFDTRNDLEHLHLMEATLGTRFGSTQLSQAASSSNPSIASLVASHSWPARLAPLLEESQRKSVSNMQTIRQLVIGSSAGSSYDRQFWDGFLDFITRLMVLDPKQRISAQEALQHPWIVENSRSTPQQ